MTVVFIQEFPIGDRSTENYEYLKERLGDDPIDGLLVHTAGFDHVVVKSALEERVKELIEELTPSIE